MHLSAGFLFLGLLCLLVQGYPSLKKERDEIDRFVQAALTQSQAYDRLAIFTDSFGSRLTGSDNLERAIDWVVETMRADGDFDSVITEEVQVPFWVRGKESLEMLSPRPMNLTLLGLGMSIGTPLNGITGEVLVVKSFDELERRAAEAKGKIVLFNAVFTSYGETADYRSRGAVEAAKKGAIACLVRSITPFSLDTPHTGTSETATIPAAAITIEDAELFQRFQDRNQRIIVTLKMEAKFLPDTFSRNVIADYHGTESPNEVVVIGGHIDSWDAGTGALDDGGGLMIAWESVRLMKLLGIRPRRTVRVVMWTNEENGARGAEVYYENRKELMDDHVYAFESDGGVFTATGIGFSGPEESFEIMRDIGERYLSPIGAGNVTGNGGGVDIDPLCQQRVPCSSLEDANGVRPDKTDYYFYYHHTKADTMSAIRREEIDSCVATMGAFAFAVADLPFKLPRFPSSEK